MNFSCSISSRKKPYAWYEQNAGEKSVSCILLSFCKNPEPPYKTEYRTGKKNHCFHHQVYNVPYPFFFQSFSLISVLDRNSTWWFFNVQWSSLLSASEGLPLLQIGGPDRWYANVFFRTDVSKNIQRLWNILFVLSSSTYANTIYCLDSVFFRKHYENPAVTACDESLKTAASQRADLQQSPQAAGSHRRPQV